MEWGVGTGFQLRDNVLEVDHGDGCPICELLSATELCALKWFK